ncbi:MAG: glycosyltransferase family 1 protein [Desulfobacteraceae bacterium]|nr:MAG: glycosyltransferase family 1 protein [Desulfobacteraceae bacterium]
MKIKILLIADFLSTGGTRVFFFRLLRIHLRNNIKTAILIQKNQLDTEVKSFCQKNDITIFQTPDRTQRYYHPLSSLIYEVIHYRKYVKRFQPDITVVSDGGRELNLGIFLVAKKIVFWLHGYPESSIIWNILRKPFRYFLTSRQKHYVAVSKYAAHNNSRYLGIPAKHIRVVHNSFQQEMHTLPSIREPIVLTVSHVRDYKNPVKWLEVAKMVTEREKTIKFVWLGDGEKLDEMKSAVQKNNLEDNIFFLGHRNDVDFFYANAMIYFQPSLIENHSISVVEAMSYGLPCIVSNAGGMPESVIHGTTGYIADPGDVGVFADRILTLFKNQKLREKMGLAGKKRAQDNFSELIQEKKIIRIYKDMIH